MSCRLILAQAVIFFAIFFIRSGKHKGPRLIGSAACALGDNSSPSNEVGENCPDEASENPSTAPWRQIPPTLNFW
jgi:hypothetical protein